MNTIISIITALGSVTLFEALKWLVNIKSHRKKAAVEADRDSWELVREQLIFFQDEVKDKTKHIRELNEELIVTKTELALKRCNREKCPHRQPPNGY